MTNYLEAANTTIILCWKNWMMILMMEKHII